MRCLFAFFCIVCLTFGRTESFSAWNGGRWLVLRAHGIEVCNAARARLTRSTLRLAVDRSSTEDGDMGGSLVSSPSSSTSSVLNCASIIAGTTIGGGFLALPYATAPAGALPSTVALVCSWLYLLLSAFTLADANLYVMTKSDRSQNSSSESVSVFSIAKASFGDSGGVAAAILFFTLMLSTLIAQLSKVGLLLGDSLFGRSGSIIAWVALMACITFGKGQQFAEKVNTTLTAVMMISFACLVAAAKGAGWSAAGLARADFGMLIPQFGFGCASWAIPIFLQLLVYAETIPLVCFRLKDRTKVRKAVFLGSFVPLLMCIVWTLTALGLVPAVAAGAITAGAGAMADPVQILMNSAAHVGTAFSWNHIVSYSVKILAFSAIATTVIGSFLVMSQFFEDLLSNIKFKNDAAKSVLAKLLAIFPGTLIASFGSPSLYYVATAFAGAFPVTLLWGLFPPLALMKLERNSDSKRSMKLPTLIKCILLATISAGLIVTNILLGAGFS